MWSHDALHYKFNAISISELGNTSIPIVTAANMLMSSHDQAGGDSMRCTIAGQRSRAGPCPAAGGSAERNSSDRFFSFMDVCPHGPTPFSMLGSRETRATSPSPRELAALPQSLHMAALRSVRAWRQSATYPASLQTHASPIP